jgi:hypothetical protein
MTVMIAARRRLAAAAAALLLAGLAACGSSGGGKAKDALQAQVANSDIAVGGPSRIVAGLFTADQRLVVFGTVEMRFSYLGTKQDAKAGAPPGPPVKATYLPVPGSDVPSPVPAKPQVVGSSQARGAYVGSAAFDKAGFWQVEVSADVDGKSRKATSAFAVNAKAALPAVGDAALPTDNLTLASTDVPLTAVDSRANGGKVPDPELHGTTIAAALAAHRPVVAVFATPVYCVSRFCGPVTDMVQELAHDYGDRASFVHVEIWRDFQNQVLNKAASDWLLRDGDLTEPWVYVIGADGKVVARFDGVTTRADLEPLLKQLPVIGAV